MQLVTLAEITLDQLGRGGFQTQVSNEPYGPEMSVVEITDSEIETLKRAITQLALQRGDPITSLDNLVLAPGYQYPTGADEFAFHIPTPNFQSNTPFAVCKTYPALKVDGRYFKLAEIHKVTPLQVKTSASR